MRRQWRGSSQAEVEGFDHAMKEHGRERGVNHLKAKSKSG
jgi:hypothetical protein